METELQLAQRAAITGAAVALPHFAALADLPRELKADGSVVTAADRAVEAAIRDVLGAARPEDAILGEEEGETGDLATTSRRWIIDPIDGTALFIRGDDRWLILIGLEEAGEIVTAVAAHPAQGSIWWAQRDTGAYEGRIVGGRVVAETAIRVSADGPSSPTGSRFAVVPEDSGSDLANPVKALTPARPWPIHPALMIARGDLDVAIQTGGAIWDFAATSLIVTEAGGAYTGVNGSRHPSPGASIYAGSEPLLKSTLDVITAPREP